jgi:hypothetical protein
VRILGSFDPGAQSIKILRIDPHLWSLFT